MTDVIKIALTGSLRSGKSSVSTILAVDHGFYTPIAFGDMLKDIAHRTFPDVPREPKPRALYQFMNVMRDFDSDVWIKHAARHVDYALSQRKTKGVVISDCRQQNEIDWCRNNGFLIVRVTASDETRIARAEAKGDVFSYEDLTHPTELEIAGFDVNFELDNSGTYAELCESVGRLMAEISASAGK